MAWINAMLAQGNGNLQASELELIDALEREASLNYLEAILRATRG